MNQAIFSAFKAYDVRSTSPDPLNADFAAKLGDSIIRTLAPKRVMVGRDMRLTSPELEAALVRVLIAHHIEVVRIGLCSTPMFNVLLGLANPKFDLGVMITASHNPGIYNGFKLTRGDCLPYGLGNGLEIIRDAMADSVPEYASEKIENSDMTDESALQRYADHVVALAHLPEKMPEMRVVIDAGNGMGGYVLPKILEKCPWIKAECLFMEPDGNFPNHEANPLKEETLEALKNKVREIGAVCGIAFDGDADRVGFVDEKGEQIRGDLLTALFASLELRGRSEGLVLSDTRASWTVAEKVKAAGGKMDWCKVGHANIKKTMRETGAVFAGELSMHFYFGNLWNVESGDYAMLVLLKELAASGKKLSQLRTELMHYSHSGEINFEVKDTKSVLQKVKDGYAAKATHVMDLDGIRCEFGNPATDTQAWWFSVRTSNTEPLVRLCLEATTKELMEQKVRELSDLIHPPDAPSPCHPDGGVRGNMPQQKYLPIAVLITISASVVFAGVLYGLFSWSRLRSSKEITGRLSGYGILAKMIVIGSEDRNSDWNVSIIPDRDLHACKLALDDIEMDLSSIGINTPSVNLWAPHYSFHSNDISANKKMEFGQNSDNSSFNNATARPDMIRLNCEEGYVEWYSG